MSRLNRRRGYGRNVNLEDSIDPLQCASSTDALALRDLKVTQVAS